MPWIETENTASALELLPGWFLTHWTKLAMVTHQADPFCCAPAWNLAFHQAINHGRQIFYAASSQSAIIFSESESDSGVPVLTPLEDSWLYGQPLLGMEAADLLSDAMPTLLERYDGKMPLFVISGIMEPSPFSARLFIRQSPAFQFYRHAKMRQCSASLLGGVDGWLSRRSANCRAKLKKARRKASELDVVFERARPGPNEARSVYKRMLAVERKSWKGLGHCGMAESPSAEFYWEMLAILAKSRTGLVIFASLNGEDIGFIFGGLLGPCYRGQQFSYSADYRQLSLGNILQFEKITWLSELGCMRYDMGPAVGPRMEYKNHWAELKQDFQTWIMRKAD